MFGKLILRLILLQIVGLFVVVHAGSQRPIRVLYTAALIDDPKGVRKADYIRNLKKLKEYGCDVYVVESCQKGPTFLDQYCAHVCYTRSDIPKGNKGLNEAISMLIGMKHFQFDPEDMILKVTGRYVMNDDQFVSLVRRNVNADIIARIWNKSDAFTGYFGMRCNHLLEFLENYVQVCTAANQKGFIEHAFADYIVLNQNRFQILPIARLYDSCVADPMGRRKPDCAMDEDTFL